MSNSMPEDLHFLRFVLPYMLSNMYLCIGGREALIIDPQPSEEALAALMYASVQDALILLTHEHFDHTAGVNFFRRCLSSVRVLAHEATAHHIADTRNNRPLSLLKMVTEENRAEILAAYHSYIVEPIVVDAYLAEGQRLLWRDHVIVVSEVPGHSPGSLLFTIDDAGTFTGDYLIPQTSVILRYPGGSEVVYREITLPKLWAIPNGRIIFPGHGEPYCFAHPTVEMMKSR